MRLKDQAQVVFSHFAFLTVLKNRKRFSSLRCLGYDPSRKQGWDSQISSLLVYESEIKSGYWEVQTHIHQLQSPVEGTGKAGLQSGIRLLFSMLKIKIKMEKYFLQSSNYSTKFDIFFFKCSVKLASLLCSNINLK